MRCFPPSVARSAHRASEEGGKCAAGGERGETARRRQAEGMGGGGQMLVCWGFKGASTSRSLCTQRREKDRGRDSKREPEPGASAHCPDPETRSQKLDVGRSVSACLPAVSVSQRLSSLCLSVCVCVCVCVCVSVCLSVCLSV